MHFRDPDNTKNAYFAISTHITQASRLHLSFLWPWGVLRSRHVTQISDPQHLVCLSISKAVFSKAKAQSPWRSPFKVKIGTKTKSKEVTMSGTFGQVKHFRILSITLFSKLYCITFLLSANCLASFGLWSTSLQGPFKKMINSLWPTFNLNYLLINLHGKLGGKGCLRSLRVSPAGQVAFELSIQLWGETVSQN